MALPLLPSIWIKDIHTRHRSAKQDTEASNAHTILFTCQTVKEPFYIALNHLNHMGNIYAIFLYENDTLKSIGIQRALG